MNELFNVKGKVVVITGGAGILGKGIAAYLAKEGAKVVVLDRSEEAGKALVDSIKAEGNEAMFLYTDVMDKEVLEGNKVEIMKFSSKNIVLGCMVMFLFLFVFFGLWASLRFIP